MGNIKCILYNIVENPIQFILSLLHTFFTFFVSAHQSYNQRTFDNKGSSYSNNHSYSTYNRSQNSYDSNSNRNNRNYGNSQRDGQQYRQQQRRTPGPYKDRYELGNRYSRR